MQTKNGSLHLFRAFGVDVFLHWSWVLVAAYQIWAARNNTGIFTHHLHSIPYQVAIYLSLFVIVLLHEFGHALACKSVGGRADRIMLWPLGGVAFVQPPPRPGALLWSIAAGPLVNVVLLPITLGPAILLGLGAHSSVAADFIAEIALINLFLLIFNMLPFYPLDGGQILHALGWFVFGRGTSLIIACCVGLCGAAVLALVALLLRGPFLAVIVVFMALQTLRGFRIGLALRRAEKLPPNLAVRCPACAKHPPLGNNWTCPCGAQFDTFATGATCPRCTRMFPTTACPNCGRQSPFQAWFPQPHYAPAQTDPTT